MINRRAALFALLSLTATVAFAGTVDAAAEKQLRDQLAKAATAQEQAALHKKLGELYVSTEAYAEAAPELLAELKLDPGMPDKDKVQIATYVSWAGRNDDAIAVLRGVIAHDPANVPAHLALARVLSWKGAINESIAEADKVLVGDPGSREALLIKANALRWKGKNREAAAIYRDLIGVKDDFDPRLGLTWALLNSRDRAAAVQSRKLLKPEFPYQLREVPALDAAFESQFDNTLSARESYYHDSDSNDVTRYAVDYSRRLRLFDLSLGYQRTQARSVTLKDHVDSAFLGVSAPAADWLRLGAGAGVHAEDGAASHRLASWRATADMNFGQTYAGVAVSEDPMLDTAQLIANGIRVLTAGGSATVFLAERVPLYGGYSRREYSDHNYSDDYTISPAFIVLKEKPSLRLGYRYRYLYYQRQSGGGYFDPSHYAAHQGFLSVGHEQGRFAISAEGFGGHQIFDRYGIPDSSWFTGIAGRVGWKLRKNLAAEGSGEFGNYAVGNATGFKYYVVGGKITWQF